MSRKTISTAMLIIAAILTIPIATAKKVKIPTDTKKSNAATVVTQTFDIDSTSTGHPCLSDITFSHFDKPVESLNESFLLTNNTDCRLIRITVSIEYRLSDIGKIHNRQLTLDCDIPPRQTRQLTVRSFDRQQTYRYTGSRVPPRRQAIPFDITLTPVSLTFVR